MNCSHPFEEETERRKFLNLVGQQKAIPEHVKFCMDNIAECCNKILRTMLIWMFKVWERPHYLMHVPKTLLDTSCND